MSKTDIFNALSGIFLFDGMDFSLLDGKYSICENCTVTECCDGEQFICNGLPVLLSGSAAVVSGDTPTVLRRLFPGDAFGAAAVFKKGSERTRVISHGKSAFAVILPDILTRLFSDEPLCCVNYISFLSDRIDFLNRKITSFTAGSSDASLALYLSSLPRCNGVCTIPVSMSALANMLGLGRASLYRSFDTLTDEGIIVRDGRSIRILKEEKLDNY